MPVEELEVQARALLQRVLGPEALVLTDVFGATPCNVAQRLADGAHVRVIAGVNVPMLLALPLLRQRIAGCDGRAGRDRRSAGRHAGGDLTPAESDTQDPAPMIKTTVTISNKLGLHARASAKLTKLAGSFGSDVFMSRNGRRVNAKSIMGVMMLAAGLGTEVELETDGADERAGDGRADRAGERQVRRRAVAGPPSRRAARSRARVRVGAASERLARC